MEKNYSRRDFLKKSVKGALGGLVAGAGLLSSIGCKGKLLFNGKIDRQRVVYYDGGSRVPFGPDRMEIYSKEGKLNKIIEDCDGNEIIGDHEDDRYIIIWGYRKIIYAKKFVNENGIKFKNTDKDSISRKAMEIGGQKLEEATKIYTDLKNKIKKRLASNLTY